MDGEGLKAWRKDRRLSQAALSRALEVAQSLVSMWESGERPIPDDLESRLELLPLMRVLVDYHTMESEEEPKPIAEVAVVAVVAPEDLPPGSPGWRYRRGTVLPKGQFMEVLPKPERFANGAVCTAIRWGSNGVGMPSMTLIGSTKEMADPVHERGSNFYPMTAGIYQPATFEAAPQPKESAKKVKPAASLLDDDT